MAARTRLSALADLPSVAPASIENRTRPAPESELPPHVTAMLRGMYDSMLGGA